LSRSIDLHGMTVAQALDAFVRYYNDCLRAGYRDRIEVVHGYGSTGRGGVLLSAVRDYLRQNSARLGSWVPGESVGNVGITIVYPDKKLPARASR